jgi:hypothetical protein
MVPLIFAWLITTDVAGALTTIPYQLPANELPCPVSITGLAAVPLILKVPAMVNSTRAVFRPAACPSVLANCTWVPACMVRKAPVGTVMLLCIKYGPPAGVQV